jgi:hypothetical protein
MFDFLFDNGLIFIAIAVFIGRFILQLRRRGREEGEKPPSQVPRFFREEEEVEDDEAEEVGRRIAYSQALGSSDVLREIVMREAAMEAVATRPPPRPEIPPAAPVLAPVKLASPPSGEESRPLKSEAAGFPASLNRLTPLRRAVILAEILGSPKGL